MNPYKVLEVPRNADAEQIKKAYRTLSRKYHPDLNKSPGAEDKFKEINRAYNILKDDDKRHRYDMAGLDAVDHYEEMKNHRRIAQCPPVQTEMNISLSEIYNGAKRVLTVRVTDEDDYGKVTVTEKKIPITIDSTFEYGKKLCIRGEGNNKPDHMQGDIIVQLNKRVESGIDSFEIDDFDLVYTKTLTLGEVISGYTFPIRHPNKETLLIKGNLTDIKETVVYKDYGLLVPKEKTRGPTQIYGNLVVKLKFDFNSLKLLKKRDRDQLVASLNKYEPLKVPTYRIPDDVISMEGQRVTNRSGMGMNMPGMNMPGMNMGMGIPGFPFGIPGLDMNNVHVVHQSSSTNGEGDPGCAQQ